MQCSIEYGAEKIQYSVAVNPALTSTVRIHVHPNGAVEAEAPPHATQSEVSLAVRKRARWISRQLENNRENLRFAIPREFVSGETHFYLGRRYPLKIVKTNDEPSSVLLKRGQLRVTLPCADRAAVKCRLENWYRARAEDYLGQRLSTIASGISWVEDLPQMKLLAMRKQWGSCSPAGAVHLNPWLVRAPRDCIDYVIIHELCHLQEHNHSKRFYELLERQLPDWGHVKARLDGMAELLLID